MAFFLLEPEASWRCRVRAG